VELHTTAHKEQLGVLSAVDKLVALGPPHMKSLKGELNLMELRPRPLVIAASSRTAR
jgi:hypothetical protein